MTWTEHPKARALAAAYVLGFLAWLVGVLWILSLQFTGGTGPQFVGGIILFAVGQALITAIAFTLRARFRDSFSQAWHHLSLGLGLPAAVKLLLAR
ncbi:hypothetical protein GCM10009789_08500 [Kribbella sancticallisti]|uniref:Uncharacterized protein n=1 Tax=Kribbella sancticallisti TaxID=460087 RepID=A0ABN2CEU6_9ACTN